MPTVAKKNGKQQTTTIDKDTNKEPPKKKGGGKTEPVARKVIYPSLVVSGNEIAQADTVLTVELCKQLLGWEEEQAQTDSTAPIKFGNDYLLTDRSAKKIRCVNNVTNRPLYMSVVETLVQEHLQKRWSLNGEPIIIGKTGLVLNGQHTLISLILAEQDRLQDLNEDKPHWAANWPSEITMEKLVVFGIDEGDRTVNTMDTCKPRSLSDVIYRSEYFAKMKPGDRKTASRMADYCIRLLWHRTGASMDAFAPRRTHSESLDFLERHSRVLRAVKHIMEEDKEGGISKFISPGYASALLYLMGSSNSDGDNYRAATPAPTEKKLNWEHWDKASDFWVILHQQTADFKEIRYALGSIVDPDSGEGGSLAEKCAVLCKAWNVYLDNGKVKSAADLELKYRIDEDGIKHLDECPNVGGIDMGDPKEVLKEQLEEEALMEGLPAEPPAPLTEEQKLAKREATKKRLLAAREKKDKEMEDKRAAGGDEDTVAPTEMPTVGGDSGGESTE